MLCFGWIYGSLLFMKKNSPQRTPRNYNGTSITTHRVGDLLAGVLSGINNVYQHRPDLILLAWPQVIGPKLASMTEALSFTEEVLTIKVRNSTLHSLLTRDKYRILGAVKQKFPKTNIRNIIFRIA